MAITISPANGLSQPKNAIDQNVFAISCIAKIDIAGFMFLPLSPFVQMIYNAIPINVNRVVQTGPNTQLGGFSADFSMVLYQVGIFAEVNIEPIAPAA